MQLMSPNTLLEREGGLPQGREMFPQTISDAGGAVSRLARSVAGKGYPPAVVPILARITPALSKHTQARVYRSFTYKHLDSDRREFDLIRKQLGLSKGELARQHGISRQSLYRCIWDGPPRLVALAILRFWISGSHGELSEEVSEPEEGMPRIPKGTQGNRCAKKKEL